MDCKTTNPPQGSLPGLNELRALAALCVIPGHLEDIKRLFGLPYHFWFPIPGVLGVILFFTLSGYLITTILLNEIKASGRVELKRFYIKRALRIWPLYFFLIGVSILIINRLPVFQFPLESKAFYNGLTTKNLLLFFFILPNYSSVLIPYAAQAWSIGIEEQFYLVQPFLIKYFKNFILLLGLMLMAIFSREILEIIYKFYHSDIIIVIHDQSVYFGCIAIGCVGALICHVYPRCAYRIIHNSMVQILSACISIAFLVAIHFSKSETVVDFRFHAVIFLIFIINASTNPKSLYNLKNNVLNYLGKISYGIYMFHPFGIGCAIAIVKYFWNYLHNYFIAQIVMYFVAFFVTILISAFSFRYFEGYFLRFKMKIPTSAV